MKKYLLGAAAALAIAAPGLAHADSGQVGAHYNNVNPSGGSDVNVYGLDLAYSHDLSNGWTIQADGASERLDSSGSHIGQGYIGLSAGVRNDSYSMYGYVGHGTVVGFVDGFGVGVGGQMYFQSATLNGSVGYADGDGGHITEVDVNGTWFFNDNFGLTGDANYSDFDFETVTSLGIGATWRFTGSPVALDVGYQDYSDDADSSVWRIGLTWNWGTDSAREQSQKGPSWDGAHALDRSANSFLY
jgi:hypothetical protein